MMAANNVPLVPDKMHAKYMPIKQQITVNALDKLFSVNLQNKIPLYPG